MTQPKASATDTLPDASQMTESAWVEVIQQMEQVYSNLINHQVELEQKNQELDEINQFISSVQRAMTEVMIVTDLSGRILQTNASLESLLAAHRPALKGSQLLSLFTDDCHTRLAPVLDKQELRDCEVTLKLPDGEVPLLINASQLKDAHQQLMGMVIIGREIGELRRAYQDLAESHAQLQKTQQQLIHAEKMASLGRLVAGVAHELNNPISFVYGNTHVLQDYGQRLAAFLSQLTETQLPLELQGSLEKLKIKKILKDLPSLLEGNMEGVERVRDIVMDLRQFSSGQQQERRPYDLVHILNTAIRWVCQERPLAISSQLPAELQLVGHPGRIHQVLMNLLQNALDAMETTDNPGLAITLDQQDDLVKLIICDNGPGIDPAMLEQIFEPFVTSKTTGKGTGLGLSLSYNFVRQQGGELIGRNHPDGGAEFVLTLPLLAPEE